MNAYLIFRCSIKEHFKISELHHFLENLNTNEVCKLFFEVCSPNCLQFLTILNEAACIEQFVYIHPNQKLSCEEEQFVEELRQKKCSVSLYHCATFGKSSYSIQFRHRQVLRNMHCLITVQETATAEIANTVKYAKKNNMIVNTFLYTSE